MNLPLNIIVEFEDLDKAKYTIEGTIIDAEGQHLTIMLRRVEV